MEQRYNSKEGKLIPTSEANKYIEDYSAKFSDLDSYTKFEMFGKEFLQEILSIVDVAGIRFYNGLHEGQTGIFLKPVNKYGKEIEIPYFNLKDSPGNTGGSGPTMSKSVLIQYSLNYPLPVVSTMMLVPLVFFLLKKIKRNDEMLIYLLYVLLKFAIDVDMIMLASEKKNNLFLDGFSILFTVILFTFCFLSIKELSKYHIIYKLILIIFIPLFIWDEYLVNQSIQHIEDVKAAFYGYPLHSLCIIAMICIFFFCLINNPHIPDILSYPFFYVCAGMLLIHSSTIFFSILNNNQFRWNVKDEWIFHIQYIFEIINIMLVIYGLTRKNGNGISHLPQYKQVELLLKHNKTLLCWTNQLEQDVEKAKNHHKVDTRINQIKNLTLGLVRYKEFLVEKGLFNEFVEYKRKKNGEK